MATVARVEQFLSTVNRVRAMAKGKKVTLQQLQEIGNSKYFELELGKRAVIALGKIETLCNQEITYLLQNLQLSSVFTTVSRYRKALKDTSDNQHPALFYFKLSKEDYDKRKQTYTQQVNKQRTNRQPFKRTDIAGYINTLKSMLSSDSYIAVAMGLCGLTGRRPSEILATATFAEGFECKYTDSCLIFTGQLKTKDSDNARDNYEIPILIDDTQLIINALARLRTMKSFDDTTVSLGMTLGQAINNLTANGQSKCVQKYLSEFFPNNKVKTYNLRALYATIARDWYCKKESDLSSFFTEILGHAEGDDTTAFSYEDFYLE